MSESRAQAAPQNSEEEASSRQTPSRLYDERYFLTDCEGYASYGDGAETAVSLRLAAALKLADLTPGKRVLDVGCGRGEAARHCASAGAVAYGVDYSASALRIAKQGIAAEPAELSQRIHLLQADGKRLPFADRSLDRLLMFDIVEHLYPWELAVALDDAWRVLTVSGRLVVHSAPNRWYYRFGYPLYRLFERLRGRRLPRDPRSRFPYHHLHVNEQDVLGLRRSLTRAGFRSKVWLENVQSPLPGEQSPLLRMLLRILLAVCPFRWVFRNDVFAVACKRRQQ